MPHPNKDSGSPRGLILKTMLPVAIGIAVVIWLLGREFSVSQLLSIPWNTATIAALVFVAGREWGMMWRWRVLTDHKLSWRQTFRITMQCEFTSAITPTTAGGSALSMIFLHREGIPLGRGASLTMLTLMLDELFVVIACPIIFLLIPGGEIFGFAAGKGFTIGVRTAFWIVYGGICLVTLILYLGALVMPHRIAAIISGIFSWRLLRRWKQQADETGQSISPDGSVRRNDRDRFRYPHQTASMVAKGHGSHNSHMDMPLSCCQPIVLGIRSRRTSGHSFRTSVHCLDTSDHQPDTRRQRNQRMALHKLLRRPHRQSVDRIGHCNHLASYLLLYLSCSRSLHVALMDPQKPQKIRPLTGADPFVSYLSGCVIQDGRCQVGFDGQSRRSREAR